MNHSWDADRLLTQYFNTPIRFYLYGRILDLTDIYTRDNRVRGIDIFVRVSGTAYIPSRLL